MVSLNASCPGHFPPRLIYPKGDIISYVGLVSKEVHQCAIKAFKRMQEEKWIKAIKP